MTSKKGKKSRKRVQGTSKQGSDVQQPIQEEVAQEESSTKEEQGGDDTKQESESLVKPEGHKPSKKASAGPVSKSAGVLALFDHPDTILDAARRARDKGFERWDVFTPFPIHGMDEAMGLGRSPVPWITFVMGVVGFCAAIIIQFGTMVYSWPINFGGKPFAAWPSFVPITFEMTVFAAGVSTAIGALLLGGVLRFRKRRPHPQVTSHRFAIFVEASDPKYDEGDALSLFESAGAIEVRAVKEGER